MDLWYCFDPMYLERVTAHTSRYLLHSSIINPYSMHRWTRFTGLCMETIPSEWVFEWIVIYLILLIRQLTSSKQIEWIAPIPYTVKGPTHYVRLTPFSLLTPFHNVLGDSVYLHFSAAYTQTKTPGSFRCSLPHLSWAKLTLDRIWGIPTRKSYHL